ncbi:VPS10 domain-containing receptor SorCS2 [Saccopteryx leptura]|uniref:VPS10 domain-containing receptor SorCS2 n=1 Tax=Saccopteryx leptura TaxID=249018 RepID=UPI00339BEA64
MAHRRPPRAPKGPDPAARAPSTEAPPPPRSPRSRPLLLLLLLLLAACGATGRSPEPGRLGPRARLTRSLPSLLARRALPSGGEDGQERGTEPGAPAPAAGPGEDEAPAAGQGRWARAAPVAGEASQAQVPLISTSFVLKGDASHNQAMVHWTGQNSSVILILTKYYHADTGKVLESSLWRSPDYGTTYIKLTLQPGFTTIIDTFYVCPKNRKKVILVSSSRGSGEESLFLSTDEASTFRKQRIPFSLEMLMYHPKQEDTLLAYSRESKVYLSFDMGRKWTLLQERVTKEHVFWAVSGVDTNLDMIHMETQDLGGGFRYVTCHIHNCSNETLTERFPGPIDHRSLIVQDDYIFLKATSTNHTKYYVSYRRNEFVPMKLPKYALPKDLQIISTDENQVFVAVQEWYQTDTYNLYQSDPRGVHYALVLEDVRSSRQAEENVIIDILEVEGVKGVFLANQKVDGKVVTRITYNKGRDWDYLRPPSVDMNGKPTNCDPHLQGAGVHTALTERPWAVGRSCPRRPVVKGANDIDVLPVLRILLLVATHTPGTLPSPPNVPTSWAATQSASLFHPQTKESENRSFSPCNSRGINGSSRKATPEQASDPPALTDREDRRDTGAGTSPSHPLDTRRHPGLSRQAGVGNRCQAHRSYSLRHAQPRERLVRRREDNERRSIINTRQEALFAESLAESKTRLTQVAGSLGPHCYLRAHREARQSPQGKTKSPLQRLDTGISHSENRLGTLAESVTRQQGALAGVWQADRNSWHGLRASEGRPPMGHLRSPQGTLLARKQMKVKVPHARTTGQVWEGLPGATELGRRGSRLPNTTVRKEEPTVGRLTVCTTGLGPRNRERVEDQLLLSGQQFAHWFSSDQPRPPRPAC